MPLVQPTLNPDAELVIAAGLLQAAGGLTNRLTVEAATERLRELLSPAALWQPETPTWTPSNGHPSGWLGSVPRWRAPDLTSLDAKLAATVRTAWRAAIPLPAAGRGTPVLRLEVADVKAAARLVRFGEVGVYRIVPHIRRQRRTGFSWRWPLRIGITEGPRSDRWRHELESAAHATLYDVRILTPRDSEQVDVALLDADYVTTALAAACVVVLGEETSPAVRLARARTEDPDAAILIATESADIGWFENAVGEMAHDRPIDVALRAAAPGALIAADPRWLTLTATKRWGLELADQLPGEAATDAPLHSPSPAGTLRAILSKTGFAPEEGGARQVADAVRSLEQQGYSTAVIRSERTLAGTPIPDPAEAPPEPLPAAPHPEAPGVAPTPQAISTDPRRLIADAYAGNRVRRRTLLPDSDHELRVKIALPKKGETAARVKFPDHELPPDTAVELMVTVRSDALDLHARKPISLSTADRSLPSTTAVFTFHTKGEGSVVDLKILVTFQERPLQEAHYIARVHTRAVPADRATLTAVPLSSSPEPRVDATPAQVSLEVNGANLVRTDSGEAVDLTQIRSFLDELELRASRVLAGDDVPETLADPESVRLLVSLARRGAELRNYLQRLRLDDARTISLLVDATTNVLPLELAYDRPAPLYSAQLCGHCHGGMQADSTEICADVDETVVCPHAFWGQRRVIARTIRLAEEPAVRPQPESLSLRPVLYAAANRADEGARGRNRPSLVLEAALADMVGKAQLTRVARWDDWVREVRERHPQLMVVLGHTEMADAETLIEIGDEARLRSPDVHPQYLRDRDSAPPLVVLLACASAVPRNCFGGLPAAFTSNGAAAVVATLSKLRGPQGALAAAAVVRAICDAGPPRATTLGAAMTAARQHLLEKGQLVGLLLVSHGEIDIPITREGRNRNACGRDAASRPRRRTHRRVRHKVPHTSDAD